MANSLFFGGEGGQLQYFIGIHMCKNSIPFIQVQNEIIKYCMFNTGMQVIMSRFVKCISVNQPETKHV